MDEFFWDKHSSNHILHSLYKTPLWEDTTVSMILLNILWIYSFCDLLEFLILVLFDN